MREGEGEGGRREGGEGGRREGGGREVREKGREMLDATMICHR